MDFLFSVLFPVLILISCSARLKLGGWGGEGKRGKAGGGKGEDGDKGKEKGRKGEKEAGEKKRGEMGAKRFKELLIN